MIRLGVICAAVCLWALGGGARARAEGPPTIYESATPLKAEGPIDKLVFANLEKLNIKPARLCADAVFIRRVYLDVIGTLPTAAEVEQFLADRDPAKRSALIDRLLQREEFADYWAMKWCDVLRVKAEFPINLWPNAVQGYHRWIRTSISQNKPYDQFARELLTASGSNFRVPEVNFYRAIQGRDPSSIARAVALTFMGCRAENWPAGRLEGMAGFFAAVDYKYTGEWKEEVVYFATTRPSASATFPDGKPADLSSGPGLRDPRQVFADWLISPQNPWFNRAIVNRTWAWLLGRGIIHEPDDIGPNNPPAVPGLLDYLERELVSSRYDIKHICRLILNSQAYQLSSIPQSKDSRAEAVFACYPLRRLDAEVLADAICQITGTSEKYSSPIPEPFTFIPGDQRSICLADGSTTSSFLELFGRPPRDSGVESERNNRVNASQRLHMLNSSHIQRKLEQGPKMRDLMQGRRTPRQVTEQLYLAVLSRYPSNEELKAIAAYPHGMGKGRDAFLDLAWVLVNSDEFLYRH